MGDLIFIGLGLHDAKDMAVKGLEAVEKADRIFAEFYTAHLSGTSPEELSQHLGKEVRVLSREEVEDGSIVLEAAENEMAVFLCVGDPMSATTHVDLRLRAMDKGVRTSVIHGSSIFTAAASLLGLQHYKFGRTTTIPYPQEGYTPESPYDVIATNKEDGHHTLVLLDIDAVGNRLMTANEAMDILLRIGSKRKDGAVTDDTLVCVVGRAGSSGPTVRAGYVRDLKGEDFGPPHHSVVVTGKLHFMEAEALVKLAGAPKDILVE